MYKTDSRFIIIIIIIKTARENVFFSLRKACSDEKMWFSSLGGAKSNSA